MSFLNSVLGSIGSGARAPLPSTPSRVSEKTAGLPKGQPTKPAGAAMKKPGIVNTTLKRKFEDDITARPANRPGSSNDARSASTLERPKSAGPSTTANPATTAAKAPPKGSFMDLMNQAKAVQAEKSATGSQVGIIKHAASKKERFSKVERRRKKEEMRKGISAQKRPELLNRSGRPASEVPKRGRPEDMNKHGATKPSTIAKGDPIRAKEREESGYKGTAGLKQRPQSKSSNRPQQVRDRRGVEVDEYESEDSFIDDDDEEQEDNRAPKRSAGRYRYAESDEDDGSSDMEAGYSDVEMEEREADVHARKDDMREKALEERLKKEKEARRKAWERSR